MPVQTATNSGREGGGREEENCALLTSVVGLYGLRCPAGQAARVGTEASASDATPPRGGHRPEEGKGPPTDETGEEEERGERQQQQQQKKGEEKERRGEEGKERRGEERSPAPRAWGPEGEAVGGQIMPPPPEF